MHWTKHYCLAMGEMVYKFGSTNAGNVFSSIIQELVAKVIVEAGALYEVSEAVCIE